MGPLNWESSDLTTRPPLHKLHSVVKESRKFKFQLIMAQEDIDTNTKPKKAAKDVKKKAKNTSLEDMKKG